MHLSHVAFALLSVFGGRCMTSGDADIALDGTGNIYVNASGTFVFNGSPAGNFVLNETTGSRVLQVGADNELRFNGPEAGISFQRGSLPRCNEDPKRTCPQFKYTTRAATSSPPSSTTSATKATTESESFPETPTIAIVATTQENDTQTSGSFIAAVVSVATVVVVIVVFAVYAVLRRVNKKQQAVASVQPKNAVAANHKAAFAIDRSVIALGRSLGSGVFGRVREAKLRRNCGKTVTVAVRVQRTHMEAQTFDAFMAEISALRRVGRMAHPNLCCIFGLCTDRQPYYIIMPYFSTGSLRSFLRNSREYNTARKTLSQSGLLGMMRQCADAVLYLHGVGVTHNCLSASCVLLTANRNCKVSDFGRDPFQYPDKEIRRWLAPEVLLSRDFSPIADVWSFGVFAWEVITLGATPYIGVEPFQLAPHLEAGNRPLRPANCPPSVYDMMQQSWQQRGKNRCTLRSVAAQLDQLINAGLPEPSKTKYPPYTSEHRHAWDTTANKWDPVTYEIISEDGDDDDDAEHTYAVPDAGEPSRNVCSVNNATSSQSSAANGSTSCRTASSDHNPRRRSSASHLSGWDTDVYTVGSSSGSQDWDQSLYDIGGRKKQPADDHTWDPSLYDIGGGKKHLENDLSGSTA